MTILQWIFAIAIFCPFLVLVASAWFFKHPDSKTTFQTAADITTPFFMIAVVIMLNRTLSIPTTWLIVLLCVIVASIVWLFDKKRHQQHVVATLRRIWRAYFLLFSVLYCCIWIFGSIISGIARLF